jgi:hypothetical protein
MEEEEEGAAERGCAAKPSLRNCDVEHARRVFGGVILLQSAVRARVVAT